MKLRFFSPRECPSFILLVAVFLYSVSLVTAQTTATTPAPTPTTPDDAAAKAAQRKQRFEEAKKRLENSDQHSQEAAKDPSPSASPNDLMLSPILVNMLVGETQRFSLFDVAGHKLTAVAEWSINDTSVADLAIQDGVPVLTSKTTGTVKLRARVDAQSTEATVNVITPEEMKPGTIRWSTPPVPGFKPKDIVIAVPSGPRPPPNSDSSKPPSQPPN